LQLGTFEKPAHPFAGLDLMALEKGRLTSRSGSKARQRAFCEIEYRTLAHSSGGPVLVAAGLLPKHCAA
jgi:hypothetical protein